MRLTILPTVASILFSAALIVACGGGNSTQQGGFSQDASPTGDDGSSTIDSPLVTSDGGPGPTDTGPVGVCPSHCTTDTECSSTCPSTPNGSNCCDTPNGMCYVYGATACPVPVVDSGMKPPPY